MDRVEGSAGFVRKRCVLRPKLLWPTIRKWGVAHTVVVFFSRSRDPEVTFRGHVMFQVLIKRRFSRRRRDFSIESDCLGLPEADSVEIHHFPRWRNPPFSKMAIANRKWFSRGVFRVGIVIFRLFRVVGVQQSTISSKAAIFQDGVLEPEVVFQTRFLRRRRDFLTESDCLGPPEAESVEIRHFPRWRTQTGSGFPGAFFASES